MKEEEQKDMLQIVSKFHYDQTVWVLHDMRIRKGLARAIRGEGMRGGRWKNENIGVTISVSLIEPAGTTAWFPEDHVFVSEEAINAYLNRK